MNIENFTLHDVMILGAAVDMWALGVITFAVLGGYLPFQDPNQFRLMKKILSGTYRYEPKYWEHVSAEAKDFISKLLVVEPSKRLTASQAMRHKWVSEVTLSYLSLLQAYD
jgi:serine/threonine protein kinase